MNKTNSFVRGSEAADKLTNEWMNAFDHIMPDWLSSFIPAYNLCKERDVDFFEISSIIDHWSNPARIEDNGINYLLWKEKSGISYMSYDGDGAVRGAFDWWDLMRCRYPHLYDGFTPGYNKVSKELNDWSNYLPYFSRHQNMREPYDYIATQVRDYFRELTDDPNVTFSIGQRSYIALNDKGLQYAKWCMSRYYYD